MMTIYYFMVIL